jgi:hypothetical protein
LEHGQGVETMLLNGIIKFFEDVEMEKLAEYKTFEV